MDWHTQMHERCSSVTDDSQLINSAYVHVLSATMGIHWHVASQCKLSCQCLGLWLECCVCGTVVLRSQCFSLGGLVSTLRRNVEHSHGLYTDIIQYG